jgi:hypothetical protein
MFGLVCGTPQVKLDKAGHVQHFLSTNTISHKATLVYNKVPFIRKVFGLMTAVKSYVKLSSMPTVEQGKEQERGRN